MKILFPTNKLWILASMALILISCEKKEGVTDITINNLKGMFVVCEGNFGSGDGDITLFNAGSNQLNKNLYYSVNSVPLGDVVQSFAVIDTLGFIVVNNSQKVTVVNMKNFKEVKTIYGFSYPRSVVRADQNTAFVSNGNGFSDNYIYSIDLSTLKKTDSLELATGPENLIATDSKVYSAISGGWNNNGNTVIEIDPVTFLITNTFEVASIPVDLAADRNNNIWVYCKGIPDYTNYPEVIYSGMGICKINVLSQSVKTFPLSSMSAPGIYNITVGVDGSIIYYLNDGLYAIPVAADALPESKLVDQSFYGVDVDPESNTIICLDAVLSRAVGFNTSGSEEFYFETDDFPNSVVFSY
jgi:hypothetical protein